MRVTLTSNPMKAMVLTFIHIHMQKVKGEDHSVQKLE